MIEIVLLIINWDLNEGSSPTQMFLTVWRGKGAVFFCGKIPNWNSGGRKRRRGAIEATWCLPVVFCTVSIEKGGTAELGNYVIIRVSASMKGRDIALGHVVSTCCLLSFKRGGGPAELGNCVIIRVNASLTRRDKVLGHVVSTCCHL